MSIGLSATHNGYRSAVALERHSPDRCPCGTAAQRGAYAIVSSIIAIITTATAFAATTSPEQAKATQWFDKQMAALAAGAPAAHTGVRLIEQGWGVLQFGWSVNHHPLKLNGAEYPTGLGTHTDSTIELTLPPDATHFSGACGVDDTADTRQYHNGVVFSITGGGKELWHSDALIGPAAPANFDLDVKGLGVLMLTAKAVDVHDYTPSDWTQLKVVRADGAVEEVGGRRAPLDGDDAGVSFIYDGKASTTFLSSWPAKSEALPLTHDLSSYQRVTRTDPATGLQCIIEAKRYQAFPVVEWTARFKNGGTNDTPILESIRSMDVTLPLEGDGNLLPPTTPVTLHYNIGDHAAADSYEPMTASLKSGDELHFAPDGGRPTDHAWPYYNFEMPGEHRGMIAVVSWPAQWSSTLSRPTSHGDELHIDGGQQLIHLRLHPGEEIRTPISVLMFYSGDAIDGQNQWRRWMIADNVPRPGGQLPPAVHATGLGLYQSEKIDRDGIAMFCRENAGLSHWWMDAGWYPCADKFWWNLTSWDPDPTRYPHGIRPISDDAHARGLKTILWFEPERAHIDGWLWKHHPEFLLTKKGQPTERLLDLGNPAAAAWLLDKVDSQLVAQGIDIYRQDFNFEPLEFWRQHDAPDRQGITEMRHVEGYLHFWDQLQSRHPNLMIDTCASGGRRLDLETLRRSVSLWSSDDSTIPEDNQSHELGVASWMPYFGSGIPNDTPYEIRSGLFPFISYGLADDRAMDWNLYRQETKNWETIHDDLLGDYYPLLPPSLDTRSWMGWQFNRPEAGRGTVQVFRRADCPYTSATLMLRELEPDATYSVTNVDAADHPMTLRGSDLMQRGLDVHIDTRPAAVIYTYVRR